VRCRAPAVRSRSTSLAPVSHSGRPGTASGAPDRSAEAGIARIEPSAIPVGTGSVLYASGWLAPRGPRVRRLEIVFAGRAFPAVEVPRLSELERGVEPRRSGFCATPVADSALPAGEHELLLLLQRVDGSSQLVSSGVSLVVEPAEARPGPSASASSAESGDPLVAICMATHEPDSRLLARQVESIREQSHHRFVCLVSDDASSSEGWERVLRAVGDDPRFSCSHSVERLGFYRNFERCLTMVPAEAQFVALADQDDRWFPEKLTTLVERLTESGARLAYADVRIVDESGVPRSDTYWVGRSNNYADLAALFLMNTVTGAASLFRRDLLDDALPFPPGIGRSYHDHWLACVALALAEIAYVDRPLQDYVQHGRNLAGAFRPSRDLRGGLVRALVRLAADPRRRLRNTADNAQLIFVEDVLRLEIFARTLELRLGERIRQDRRADVRTFARLSTSARSLLTLLRMSAVDLRGDGPSLGAENQLLKGIIWRDLHLARTRLGARLQRRTVGGSR
jgi:glycosyltransferase involved in cell wall biosynthesis